MRFRVLGVGFFLIVSVSVGLAGAQPAPAAGPGSHAEGTTPAQAAFPSLEAAPAPTSTEPPPAAIPPAAPAQPPTRALTPEGDKAAPTGNGNAGGEGAGDKAAPTGNAGGEGAGQSYFGFGAQVGFYNPNGITVRLGVPAIALEATAGFAPLLLSYRSYSSDEDNALKFLMPVEISPQLMIHVLTFKHEMRGNLLLGYRYNRALGNGVTLGGEIESRVTRKLALQGLWGISVYPHAVDRLRGDRVPADTEFKFPPWFGYGLSVGLLFYP